MVYGFISKWLAAALAAAVAWGAASEWDNYTTRRNLASPSICVETNPNKHSYLTEAGVAVGLVGVGYALRVKWKLLPVTVYLLASAGNHVVGGAIHNNSIAGLCHP